MAKAYLKLQATEQAVVTAAATIYGAYITSGQVEQGSESKWMERSLREAIRLARAVDELVIAEGEMD